MGLHKPLICLYLAYIWPVSGLYLVPQARIVRGLGFEAVAVASPWPLTNRYYQVLIFT
jgi:hypothetical protein